MFEANARVEVIPHRNRNADGSPRPDYATVVNPQRPTDMLRLDGSAVGYYVDVRRDATPSKVDGYHATSLKLL